MLNNPAKLAPSWPPSHDLTTLGVLEASVTFMRKFIRGVRDSTHAHTHTHACLQLILGLHPLRLPSYRTFSSDSWDLCAAADRTDRSDLVPAERHGATETWKTI